MKKLLKILGAFCILIVILNFVFPLQLEIDYSKIVYDRNGEVLATFLNKEDKWRFESELGEISQNLIDAVLEKEDKYFYYHPGFNPVSIARAVVQNTINGEVVSGASTITMQVARLLAPKERTIWNKIRELFTALQLEVYYSKNEILELYLNLIPFGSNIEGVKAVSIFYLNKLPKSLSLSESIALSLIPNNPNYFKIGKYNGRINNKKNSQIKYYLENKTFPNNLLYDALNEVFHSERIDRPNLALHFSTRIISNNRNRTNINSTIDLNTQSKIETITKSYIKGLNSLGIYNASVIVADNITGEVIAYLGSNDFYDNQHEGQVDGIKSIRSPGSTLKPIVYLLAMDKGIATPKTILHDIPLQYGNYSPQNFDQNFRGLISAEHALAQSLNVPAVYLLNEVGIDNFIQKLIELDFESISKNNTELGLSTVLGGCGVSLEELTRLYMTLANNGEMRPIVFLKDSIKSESKIIFNKEATMITKELLTKLQRPDYPTNYQSAIRLPRISWKTGTSYGRKDAWSIGFTDRYTVGVWAGNFDNKSVASLTGASVATPLLFEIFNLLQPYNSQYYLDSTLPKRKVCTVSGLVPNQHCTELISDYYIPFKSSNIKCNHIKEVYVTIDEKTEYCTDCLPPTGFKTILVENTDPILIDYYNDNNIIFKNPIKHNNKCARLNSNYPPKIISPLVNQTYFIDPKSDKILLSAVISQHAEECSWFINDEYFRTCKTDEQVYYVPKQQGPVKVSCTDNLGNTSTMKFTLEFY